MQVRKSGIIKAYLGVAFFTLIFTVLLFIVNA